ncbi:hypothetical protein ABZP36_015828 [Zizania latifolia]
MMALRRLAKEATTAHLRRGGSGGGGVSPHFAPPRTFSAAPRAPPVADPALVGKHGLQRVWPRCSSPALQAGAPNFGAFLAGRMLRGVHPQLAGHKLLKGLGVGFTVAAILCSQTVADAEEQQSEETEGITRPSAKHHISKLWPLVRKYQLPFGLVVLIALGWQNPLGLVINILLLLYSSRPNPYSIYLFLREVRHGEVHQNPAFWNEEVVRTRKVEAKDYKFFAIGTVELADREVLHTIGILGSWWIYRTSYGK